MRINWRENERTPEEVLEAKRVAFAALRDQAIANLARHGKGEARVRGFIAKVARKDGDPTPDSWVAGAQAAWLWALKEECAQVPDDHRERCDSCAGTGRYWFSHTSSGPCFRCEGKGKQTQRDVIRNRWYDALYSKVRI
jgi:hypothetical protein